LTYQSDQIKSRADLDQVLVLLRGFRRIVAASTECELPHGVARPCGDGPADTSGWVTCFNTVLRALQAVMKEEYRGGTLPIEPLPVSSV